MTCATEVRKEQACSWPWEEDVHSLASHRAGGCFSQIRLGAGVCHCGLMEPVEQGMETDTYTWLPSLWDSGIVYRLTYPIVLLIHSLTQVAPEILGLFKKKKSPNFSIQNTMHSGPPTVPFQTSMRSPWEQEISKRRHHMEHGSHGLPLRRAVLFCWGLSRNRALLFFLPDILWAQRCVS